MGDFFIRSWNKSGLSVAILHNKDSRVKRAMVRLTNLLRFSCLKLGFVFIIANSTYCKCNVFRMCYVTRAALQSKRHRLLKSQGPKARNYGFKRNLQQASLLSREVDRGYVKYSVKRSYNTAANISNLCVSFEVLLKNNFNNKKFQNHKLIHILSDVNFLFLAYKKIKSEANNAKSFDSFIVWFKQTAKLLKAGQFKFKPAKKQLIPKPAEKNCKEIFVINLHDKIVQQAIYLILEGIFKPTFLDFSHSAKKGKGSHSAFKQIKKEFQGVKWCFNSEIKNSFDSINHKILLDTLKTRIYCDKFLALVKNLLKSGFSFKGKTHCCSKGLLQGGICSSLLNNIYLTNFDNYLNLLKIDFTSKAKSRRKNPVYRNLSYKIDVVKDNPKLKKHLILKRRAVYSKDLFDPNFKRFYCIRYFDNLLVGIVGSKTELNGFIDKITKFLKDKLLLEFSAEQSFITNFGKQFTRFLGVDIKGNWERQKRVLCVKRYSGKQTFNTRITGNAVFYAPIKELFIKLAKKGFFKRRNVDFVPTFVGRCINFDHATILQYYNSVIRGLLNYFCFVNNHKSLGSIIHGLKFSCARTFALKYKVRHAAKIFKRFGGFLKCPVTSYKLFIPSTFKASKKFGVNPERFENIINKTWNNKLTKSNLFKTCVICGSNKEVQMHHLKKIKDLKSKNSKLDFFTKQMAAINRKQIPLCSFHHNALHKNKLSADEKAAFTAGLKNL